MFRPNPKPSLLRGARHALEIARSLLLLEDDVRVDWEVDGLERAGLDGDPTGPQTSSVEHPHAGRLSKPRDRVRRPGESPSAPQVCLCPLHAPRRRASLADRPRRAPLPARKA